MRGRTTVGLVALLVAVGGCGGSSAHGDLNMDTLAAKIKSSVALGTTTTEWQHHVDKVTCVKTGALEASCALDAPQGPAGEEANEPGSYNETVRIAADGESYEAAEPSKAG